MLTLKTPTGTTIDVHDDVRHLSAARYQRFCAKYLEYSVGSDLFQAEGHLGRMAMFLGSKDYQGLRGEFNHLVQNLNNVRHEVSGPAVVLSVLIARIGEQECLEYSDSALAARAQQLLATGISQGKLDKTLQRAKKRLSATS